MEQKGRIQEVREAEGNDREANSFQLVTETTEHAPWLHGHGLSNSVLENAENFH